MNHCFLSLKSCKKYSEHFIVLVLQVLILFSGNVKYVGTPQNSEQPTHGNQYKKLVCETDINRLHVHKHQGWFYHNSWHQPCIFSRIIYRYAVHEWWCQIKMRWLHYIFIYRRRWNFNIIIDVKYVPAPEMLGDGIRIVLLFNMECIFSPGILANFLSYMSLVFKNNE